MLSNFGGSLNEIFFQIQPNITHLCTFGYLAYIHLDKTQQDKLQPRVEREIFLGYDDAAKGYRLYNLIAQKLKVTCDVTIDKTRYISDPG